MKQPLFVGVLVGGLAAAGCASQALQGTVPPAQAPPPQTDTTQVRVTVALPQKTAIRSASFRLPGMKAAQVMALSPGSASCPAGSHDTYRCTVSFDASGGKGQALAVKTYASADGSGTPLSDNVLSVNVATGKVATVAVTVNGVAKGLALTLDPPTVSAHLHSTIAVTWSAQDAAGETIIGPRIVSASGKTFTPALTTSDRSGAIRIGHLKGATWKVRYTGAVISSPAFTVVAGVHGVASANVHLKIDDETGPRPASPGDNFTYSGTYQQQTVYTYPTPTNSPFPIGSEPPVNASAQVTQNILVTTTPCPQATGNVSYNCANPSDFHDNEVDAFALQSLYPTTDAWYTLDASNNWSLFGSSVTDGNGNTYYTSYATPQILDQLPETQGASWSNSPAASYVEYDADGTITEQNVAADGSYVETQKVVGGYGLGITTSAVGSPLPGASPNVLYAGALGAGDSTFATLGLPANTSTNNGGSIFAAFTGFYAITIATPGPTSISVAVQPTNKPTATPRPVATPNVWYTPPAANSLYSETDSVVATDTALPQACSVPSQFGTTGNEIQQQINDVDPVLGYTSAQTVTTWTVDGYGPVCVQMNNVQTSYYNWNNDSYGRPSSTPAGWTPVFGKAAGPAFTTTVSETLTLQSASGGDIGNAVHAGRGERPQNSRATALTPLEIGIARARFDAMVRHKRTLRIKQLSVIMNRLIKAGGHHHE